jgi:hypothetical protein
MNSLKPETWPDGAYFSLGAFVGLLFGAGVISLLEFGLPLSIAAIAASAVVFGCVGVAIREDLLGVIIHWF